MLYNVVITQMQIKHIAYFLLAFLHLGITKQFPACTEEIKKYLYP